jgi:hypothetical protein
LSLHQLLQQQAGNVVIVADSVCIRCGEWVREEDMVC